MFDKSPHEVEDLNGFLQKIAEITTTAGLSKTIYRGQLYHKKYSLIPSLQRKKDDGTFVFDCDAEKVFFEKFKSKVIPYLSKMPNNYWEWLFLMQHYRAPTRLLDWSESPLISLFFALDTEQYQIEPDDSPVVWCLNTYKLNEKFGPIQANIELPNICDSDDHIQNNLQHCFKYKAQGSVELPLAITGPLNSIRISSQKGLFTLFPYNNDKSIEEIETANDFLEQIVIKPSKINEIRKQLFKIGISYSSIYPEIDSVAKDIVIEYKMQKGDI